jgi:hypothetical protein
MILVPAGAAAVPAAVTQALQQVFDPAADWCSGANSAPSCLAPGFAVTFGGPTLVTDGLMASLDTLVSGGTTRANDARGAVLDEPFATGLDLAPVFDLVVGDSEADWRVCAARGSYQNARWLVLDGAAVTTFDLVSAGVYARDGDDEERSPGTGRPWCAEIEPDQDVARAWVVSATGRQPAPSDIGSWNLADQRRFTLSGVIAATSPTRVTGEESDTDPTSGGSTSWEFTSSPAGITAVSEGETSAVTRAEITISLVRGSSGTAPDTFTAEFEITTAQGTVEGTAQGEAVLAGGVWTLRGGVEFDSGSWTFDSGRGGFLADLDTESAGSGSDDSLQWRVDGVS